MWLPAEAEQGKAKCSGSAGCGIHGRLQKQSKARPSAQAVQGAAYMAASCRLVVLAGLLVACLSRLVPGLVRVGWGDLGLHVSHCCLQCTACWDLWLCWHGAGKQLGAGLTLTLSPTVMVMDASAGLRPSVTPDSLWQL